MPPVKLPAFVTPALLSSIRGHPQLPHHSWYFIAGVTLSVLNRPDEIANVFKHALETGSGRTDTKPEYDEQLQMARKLREALVKAAPIGGLPKVLLHCEALFNAPRAWRGSQCRWTRRLTLLPPGYQCSLRTQSGHPARFARRATGIFSDIATG